jgi:hypothetical protein
MNKPFFSIATGLAVTVMIGATNALAQPPEQRKQSGHRHEAHQQRNVSIDEALVRSIFRSEAGLLDRQASLPPGIRKNLARGKPLPPGLAKRFDPRLDARLPQYSGYEWMQVGRDAVLIGVTTGIVEAVLDNIFD